VGRGAAVGADLGAPRNKPLLRTRIVTAAILVAAALVCVLVLPSWLAVTLFGLVWVFGAAEWARLVPASGAWAGGYVALVVALALGSGPWFDAAGAREIAFAATVWWTIALLGVLAYPWRIPALVVSAAGIAALVPSWVLLAYVQADAVTGPRLVLAILCVVWAADVGAFFCGRWFGHVKLAPRVSPGKTWAGVAGGLAAATAVGLAAGAWLGQPLWAWAVTAFVAAAVSIVGDLTVSVCKRRAGKKDSGHLLPGHGGVLDRIDSLTAAIPVFFLSLSLTGLVP
jgi:phosphatidate cytidylyltransferase